MVDIRIKKSFGFGGKTRPIESNQPASPKSVQAELPVTPRKTETAVPASRHLILKQKVADELTRSSISIVVLTNLLIDLAYHARASDIHIDPYQDT